MSLPASKAQAIARALLVTPLGVPHEDALAYAKRWFGPECVRMEIIGHSATEYDDERTTDHGDRYAIGYTQDGQKLDEVFVKGDPETTDSYWEALAAFEADLEKGEADEPEGVEDTWDLDFHEAREKQIDELASLSEGLHYWGDPERDPYAAERELADKLDAAV